MPWICCELKPGLSVGTTKQPRPRCFFSGSVWAKISAMRAWLPSEMNIFEPEITQPPFLRLARVSTEAASEPVPGSVSPKQPSHSPEQSFGSSDCFCCLASPLLDRAGDERGLDRHDRADGGVRPPDLLHDQPVAHVVEAATAVLLGDRSAEVAHLTDPLDQLEVEALVAIVVAGARDDLAVGEVARRLADQALLVGEVKIHEQAA